MSKPKDPRIAALEAEGFVVLRAKSYRQAQMRQDRAQMRAFWAHRDRERSEEWARDCLAQERRLSDRCTYLYGLAAAKGATVDELSGVAAVDHPDTAATETEQP